MYSVCRHTHFLYFLSRDSHMRDDSRFLCFHIFVIRKSLKLSYIYIVIVSLYLYINWRSSYQRGDWNPFDRFSTATFFCLSEVVIHLCCYCLFISVYSLETQLSERDPFDRFSTAMFFVPVSSQDTDFQCQYGGFFCSIVRGDYQFCEYWRNSWPSFFKLSFHNLAPPRYNIVESVIKHQ